MEDLLNFSFQNHSYPPKKTPLWFQPIQLPGQSGFLLQGDMGLGQKRSVEERGGDSGLPWAVAGNRCVWGWGRERERERERQAGRQAVGLSNISEIWSPGLWLCEWKVTCVWAGKYYFPELVCYSQYARKVSEKRQQESSKEVTQDSPQPSKLLSLTNDICFPFPLLILSMIIKGGQGEWFHRLHLGVACVSRLPVVRFDHPALFWGSRCVLCVSVQTDVCI